MTQDAITEVVYFGRMQMNAIVVCMTLIVYDHLHTLPMEIRYMWSRRLSMVNVLYYVSKYWVFISVVDLYRFFAHSMTAHECQRTAYIYASNMLSIWTGEAVLGIRIWAIWGKKRCLTITLPLVFLVLFVTNGVFILNYIGSMEYSPSPAPQFVSCFVTKANQSIYVLVICLPVWIALMFILLTTSAYFEYKNGGNTRFIRMIYREGISYYFTLLLLNAGSLVICYKAPIRMAGLLTSPLSFLHVSLASRVILHIRKQAHMGVPMIGQDEDNLKEIHWT